MGETITFYLDPDRIESESRIAKIQAAAVLSMAVRAPIPERAKVIEEIQNTASWCCDFFADRCGLTEQDFDAECEKLEREWGDPEEGP